MNEIHCHVCGGFIKDPANVSYRKSPEGTIAAGPHSAICPCTPAIVYGISPGYLTWPGLANLPVQDRIERSRVATQN
jgi:hypothetical protein